MAGQIDMRRDLVVALMALPARTAGGLKDRLANHDAEREEIIAMMALPSRDVGAGPVSQPATASAVNWSDWY